MSKKKMSETTQKYKTRATFYKILDVILTYGPFVGFAIISFVGSTPVQKLGLSAMMVIAACLAILNILYKKRFRSLIWILLLGFTFVLTSIAPMVVIIAVCTLLDEIFVEPMYRRNIEKYKINKEIDKREQ